jgi:hypothetical protein
VVWYHGLPEGEESGDDASSEDFSRYRPRYTDHSNFGPRRWSRDWAWELLRRMPKCGEKPSKPNEEAFSLGLFDRSAESLRPET